MSKRFTVGVDISPLQTHLKIKRGIGQSTLRLARELINTSLPFNLVFYASGREPLGNLLPWADVRYVPDPEWLPDILRKDRVDLIHFSDYFYPIYSPGHFTGRRLRFLRTLVTAYDLIPLYSTDSTKRSTAAHAIVKNLLAILNHVDGVRSNSNNTKRELARIAGVDERKITVIHHGLDHSVFHPNYPADEISNIMSLYGLKRGFILQVAAMDRRKNQITLLKAYKKLVDERNLPLELVFAGGKPGCEILNFVQENTLGGRVKFLGTVPDSHLPLIYCAAGIFAFPSYYEGFGNPPLEAMACGLPVISSNRGSLPEILGRSAIYVHPLGEEELAEAILTVHTRPEVRNEMVAGGLQNVQKFTWQNTVLRLVNLYREVMSEGRETWLPGP